MRRKHKKYRGKFGEVLLVALPVVSHIAAIIGTVVIIIDLIHHW
jgi:hypothetical protein